MHIKNTILPLTTVITLVSSDAISTCQSGETFTPSTFCVHTNEQVFLRGEGFQPNAYIQGFLLSSHYKSPLWSFNADTNGEFMLNITWRENIDPNGPRAVQEYQFSGGSTNITFHVWYQTNNPTNDWHGTITSFDASPISSEWQQVDVYAAVTVANNYQVQMATNLSGPWIFVGETTTHENLYSDVRFGFQIPRVPQAFFRVANPYLPCPCDF